MRLSCFLWMSRKDKIIRAENVSPAKRPLSCCPYLHDESYPTRLGWFLFLIVVYHPLCLSPILQANSPTPHLHLPHRSYPFSCYGRRNGGSCFSLRPVKKNYTYILTNFSTFNKHFPCLLLIIIRCTVFRE
jgi:hypothetical protein